tara:strand:+ start:1466 stop:1861 length:396 start_codon:yes stop_codon:yes gene_type:complete
MDLTVKKGIATLRESSKILDEYKPINRIKLLETILKGIFQDYEFPKYHDEKPNVKDCSFVLTFLYEHIVLKEDFEFDDKYFKEELTKFCYENFITLDLKSLLNALTDSSIIRSTGLSTNYFKNANWLWTNE